MDSFFVGLIKEAQTTGFLDGFKNKAPLTTPKSFINPKTNPSYVTNVAQGVKQNLNPQADPQQIIKNTRILSPDSAQAVRRNTTGLAQWDSPPTVELGMPGSQTNNTVNPAMYAHELMHAQSIGADKLPTYRGYPDVPRAINAELNASAGARKILGTNYNANSEQILSKALSTYLMDEANNPSSAKGGLAYPKFTRGLYSLLSDKQDTPPLVGAPGGPPVDFSATNAFPGYEKMQDYSRKLLDDSYRRYYPAVVK